MNTGHVTSRAPTRASGEPVAIEDRVLDLEERIGNLEDSHRQFKINARFLLLGAVTGTIVTSIAFALLW